MRVDRWLSIVLGGLVGIAVASVSFETPAAFAQTADCSAGDADGDGACDEVDNCPDMANPDQVDQDADSVGDACDDCPWVADPDQMDTNGDGVADACGVRVRMAAIANDGHGHLNADVQIDNPSGMGLSGKLAVLGPQAVSSVRFDWLATSCRYPQDDLDLTINDVVVARVVPEPEGPLCICLPLPHGYEVPLADALALLEPGVNLLGIRKNTGLPVATRTLLAWAYATITIDGIPYVVPLFDQIGVFDFALRNICGSRSTGRVVDAGEMTPELPAPLALLSWEGALPCSMDLSSVPAGPVTVVVTATDGSTSGSASRDVTLTGPSSIAFCDDGDPCTVDTCGANGCEHAPVVCGGGTGDACNAAGTCDPSTGQCMGGPSPDGTACDDGNACTQNDACQAGVCTPGAPMICAGAGGCREGGTCDPATGQCTGGKMKRNGSGCDDGNACTRKDTCRAGVCVGRRPVVCARAGQCQEKAVCNPTTGMCMEGEMRPDGTACRDKNLCTQMDTCQAGRCVGGDPVVCHAPDACHVAECQPRSGWCKSYRVKPFQMCRRNK